MIAVISYNALPGIRRILGLLPSERSSLISLYENIFNPKSPQNVSKNDPQFQELFRNKEAYERIIIFAGKKSSGALEIITLFSREFAGMQEKLFFVLCDHDLNEKLQLLERRKIFPWQFMTFADNNYLQGMSCDEEIALIGKLASFISDY